jgi:hypothetical protein
MGFGVPAKLLRQFTDGEATDLIHHSEKYAQFGLLYAILLS